jgi:GNAT superfamily N-acetyltransferase
MPRLSDLSRVRALLDRDRAWAAYAIGDLAPEFVDDCSWHTPADGAPALVMLYAGFDPPILFAMGDGSDLSSLFAELRAPIVSLHVQPEALAALSGTYLARETSAMWRMVVDPASFQPASATDVVALGQSDLAAIQALYDEGRQQGEGPAFFFPWMLEQGTFRGIWEGSDLVAVAGTHLVSRELGICTIGNVYTRRDRRRLGLAARVTTAVVQHALAQAISTIVLNVSQRNERARRVYEAMGFRCYCAFFEGEARRAGN